MTGLSTHIGKSWGFFLSACIQITCLKAQKGSVRLRIIQTLSCLSFGECSFSLTLASVIWALPLVIVSLNLNVYATADSYSSLKCIFFPLHLWFSLGLHQLNSYSILFSDFNRGSYLQLAKVLPPVPFASWFSCITSVCPSAGSPPLPSINCLPFL